MSNRKKYVFTAAAFFGYFSFGLMDNINGGTLLDIAGLTCASGIGEIYYGVISQTIAYCLGSLFFGWLYGRVNRQVGYIVSLIASGCATLAIPHLRTASAYIALQVFFGLFIGGLDVASNAWILEIWGNDSKPFMQAMYLCYAIGMPIINAFISPFLSTMAPGSDCPNKNDMFLVNLTDISSILSVNETAPGMPSRIVVPYTATGVIVLAAAAILAVLLFFVPYLPTMSTSTEAIASEAGTGVYESIQKESRGYRLTVVALGCLLFTGAIGMQQLTSQTYMQQFVHFNDLKISTSVGSLMTSLMSFSYAVSLALGVPISTRLSPKSMVITLILLMGSGSSLLYLFGNASETMIWISVVLLGAGFGSSLASIYAFIGERVEVTDGLCGFFMFSARLSLIPCTLILAGFIESKPMTLIYLNLLGFVLCCLMVLGILINDSNKKEKEPILSQ